MPGGGSAPAASTGASRPATRSTATSSCGSKAIARAGRLGERPPHLHRRVVLAGDHVRVGDDHFGPAPPSPSPRSASPQAVPSTRTTLREAARTPGVARDPRRRRRHIRRRAGDRRQRVQARERVEDRPGRRQHLVRARAGSPSAGCRRAARPGPASAPRPRRRSTRCRAPSAAPSSAPSRPSSSAEPGHDQRAPQP